MRRQQWRRGTQKCAMPFSLPTSGCWVGRTPTSAADALIGLLVRISLLSLAKSGSRGTRADQGSAPLPYHKNPSIGRTKWHCTKVRALRVARTLVFAAFALLRTQVFLAGSRLACLEVSPMVAISRLHINGKMQHFCAYLALSSLPVIGFEDRRRGAGQHFRRAGMSSSAM
jgi:hypothetical protein